MSIPPYISSDYIPSKYICANVFRYVNIITVSRLRARLTSFPRRLLLAPHQRQVRHDLLQVGILTFKVFEFFSLDKTDNSLTTTLS
jgi:hypothetical protein